jgi:hypothetical protein
MKLINDSNETLEIIVSGYHITNSHNKRYDSDWLDAELIIKNEYGVFIKQLEFLIVEELERMEVWLKNIFENKIQSKELDFVDPCLKLKLMKRSGIQVIKIIYETSESNKEVWEMRANENEIPQFIKGLNNILIKFPCRCGAKHLV